MTRQRLPNRRACVTSTVEFGSRWIDVTLGRDPTGAIKEVFIKPRGQSGSEIVSLAEDASVLISRLLQHDDRLEAIGKGLGKTSGQPASLIGAAIAELLLIEGAR